MPLERRQGNRRRLGDGLPSCSLDVADVVGRRGGLNVLTDDEVLDFDAIGKFLGVTGERARQEYVTACAKVVAELAPAYRKAKVG